MVEIQCHGGSAALELVIEALQAAGAVLAEQAAWAEVETSSRIQAEALIDLASLPRLRTAEILLEQSQGALDRELARADSSRFAEDVRRPSQHSIASSSAVG